MSGSGTTVLTFRYTVASPDYSADLEYSSTAALSGGTIKDVVGNDANLTLPTVATSNSLGGSKNLEIAGNSNAPVLSASTSSTNAYVGTAITAVNVNNNTGNDSTNDSRALTYTCFYDNTVNGAMDSGGTACSSLGGATFTASTGVLTWTPTSTQQAAYNNAKNYEFFVTGNSSANRSGTVYYTVRVIRPWTTGIGYDPGTASSYTFDSSLIEHTNGSVNLLAKDQLDGDGEDWAQSGLGGTERKGAPYNILKLGLNGFCGGHGLNCYGAADQAWTPQSASRVKYIDFGGSADSQFPGMSQAAANKPTENVGEQKIGWTSYTFDGDDYAYHSRGIGDDFSINIWIKTTQSAGTGDCTAFHHGAGIVTTEQPGLVNDFGLTLCDGYIIAGTGNVPTSSERSIRSKYRHNDGVWHMLTFTRVKSSGLLKLYVDGLLQGSDTNGSATLNAATNIYYGRKESAGSMGYVGLMDQATHWSTALTDAEVQLIFERQNPRGSGLMESRIMDAGYAGAPWTSFTIATNLPAGKELPDGAASETTANYATTGTGLMTGIKGLWHFNETSGNYMDRSGSGAHGNSASTSSGAGKFLRSATFNGAANHINLGSNNSLSFGSGSFTSSMWFRTPKVLGSGNAARLFSNGYYGVNSGWFLRIHDKYINFGIGCTGTAANCVNVIGTKLVADNQWHHVVTVTDKTANKVRVFIDGVQESITSLAGGTCGSISGKDLLISSCSALNADRTTTYAYFGVHDNANEFYEGSIDETAMWGRALSDAEALSLYKRGATKIMAQVKTCANLGCTDDPTNTGWKGPDGTMQSYFSEINNNSAPSTSAGTVNAGRLTLNFANYGLTLNGRYFQYRLILESDDRNNLCNYGSAETCSPEVVSLEAGPAHYPIEAPIVYNTGTSFYTINTLTEGGPNCSAGIKYQLSLNNSIWYYHNGTTWVTSNGSYSQSNTPGYFNTVALDFANVAGRGTIYVKAVLGSTGTTTCLLGDLTLTGNASY